MKKIAILGSTGSIGNSTLNVIEANPGVFSITLLIIRQFNIFVSTKTTEFWRSRSGDSFARTGTK